MMENLLLGSAIGAIAGVVLAIPGVILESARRTKNLPLIIDVKEVWGKKLTDNEVFLVSLLIHLIFSTLAGTIYVLFAESGWLFITNAPYALHSIEIFAVFAWAVTGALLYPLLGFGFFGRREGHHIWFEMLVTQLLLGLLFWLAIRYYQPFFF